jgi:hypothetical protein
VNRYPRPLTEPDENEKKKPIPEKFSCEDILERKRLKDRNKREEEPKSIAPRPSPIAPAVIPSGIDQFAREIGTERFLEGCKLSSNQKAHRICQLYQNNKEKRTRVTLEQLCQDVDLDPNVLIGTVVSALYAHGYLSSKVVAATHLPEMVRASVKRGRRLDGVEDRRMQFEMGGLLKGDAGININIGGLLSTPEGLPAFEEDTKESIVDADFEVVDDS